MKYLEVCITIISKLYNRNPNTIYFCNTIIKYLLRVLPNALKIKIRTFFKI